ncbi:V-type ATP synthase subunit I domain-containing protein [Mycoplasma parvum]|uniref:Uncharacterized protein n=1 Tax=Mycoplasma parvum str. Indiana TaxID=1403316 RepID=U5NF66_9MOLU|nr:hypothetical protein [Mycoplasma parvum]AGX88833.1 hypothetical protein PRV_00240 [Mycoplasma parvum str. Indiana]
MGGGFNNLDFHNVSGNKSLKLNNSSIDRTKLELDKVDLEKKSLEVNLPDYLENIKLDLKVTGNLSEVEGTLSSINQEIKKEKDIEGVGEERESRLKESKKEVEKFSGDFKTVLENLKDSKTHSQASGTKLVKKRSLPDNNEEIKQLTKEQRNSVYQFFKQKSNLEENKEKLSKKLEQIQLGALDEKNKLQQLREVQNKNERVLKSLEKINWFSQKNIKFDEFTKFNYWDNNPYSDLLSYEEWTEINEIFKQTGNSLEEMRKDPLRRTCSLFLMIFFSSHVCYRGENDLKELQEKIKKKVPSMVALSLFQKMGIKVNEE